MQLSCRFARSVVLFAAIIFALVVSAYAQISVTSPANGATVYMPVWLRAHVDNCNGSTATAFGYSINNSPFITWGITDHDIDTSEFRLSSQPSPGAAYTIHFKAWSSAGQCPVVDVNVNVTGSATMTVKDINYATSYPNSPGWSPAPSTCGTDTNPPDYHWYWVWDSGTAGCTFSSDTSTYATPSGGPNVDGKSRIFYVDWQANTSNGTPGERYSIVYDSDSAANHFVYDTYIYITDPQNVYAVEMDTNWVDPNGDVDVIGLQCVLSSNTWEFTTVDAAGNTQWKDPVGTGWTQVPCSRNDWTPNTWHHVQLAAHRNDSGDVYYDMITFDGTRTYLSGWYGYSRIAPNSPWTPGKLVLNFQIDGINNGQQKTTATVYLDGMDMIRWTQ